LAVRPKNNKAVVSFTPISKESSYRTYRRPFWLPAPAYYILAVAISAAIFFLAWGILHEGEEMPWIPAGILASITLATAVVVREFFLRRARNRFLRAQNRLDYNLKSAAAQHKNKESNKLTIEQNAAIVRNIERKSEAAKVLGKLPDTHWEVFEICNEYLQITERELQTVGVGSPRLPALRLGREKVQELHKFHLLTWAAVETKTLTQEARIRATIAEKLETAQKALAILDSALEFYPAEAELIESATAVEEFIASIKISHWIEQAERSAFKGNYKRAISHYRDALFYLARENVRNEEREMIAEKINAEIEKLREISGEEKEKKQISPRRKRKDD
jgi:tetratricopeptide (TPR) repeat protein